MRTPKELYPQVSEMFVCELDHCPICEGPLTVCDYRSGRKTVQTLSTVLQIVYWPKQCADPNCSGHQRRLRSAQWLQVAPFYCTYGYDVIASIGWQRQTSYQTFEWIHADMSAKLKISESQVRHLYHQRYLPLLACHEREHFDQLERVAQESGLIVTLDGLAPEGGEPQLWVVRELQTNLTLRSGWLSEQGQDAFKHFLQPIADLNLHIAAILSDKQRGLVPAVGTVFPNTKHAFCQIHYLQNIAKPVAAADEHMKVTLRKAVREEVGALIRPEHVEEPGVLTVTGLIPSPIEEEKPASVQTDSDQSDSIEQEREAIVRALTRRVRYLLTLKARPPFRLAGLEMFERLIEVVDYLKTFIAHAPDERLIQLQEGVSQALRAVADDCNTLRQAARWLEDISNLLDPDGKPPRTGEKVREQLLAYVNSILEQSQDQPVLAGFAGQIYKTTSNYEKGLFHTYDIPALPRTNNDREREFRDLNRRLLATTRQKGATRRIIQRSGAWELIPIPGSLSETVAALSQVDNNEFRKERERVRTHRDRFRLHTRSAKQARMQLQKLQDQWLKLPRNKSPG